MCFYKNRFLAALTLILCSGLWGCSTLSDPSSDRGGITLEIIGADQKINNPQLTIISSTDFHATIDKAEDFTAAHRYFKKHYSDAITVSAGDLFQGSIEGNESQGRAVIDLFNLVGMDLVAMGNHDIDYGPSRKSPVKAHLTQARGALNDRVAESKFHWLSVNIIYKKDHSPKRPLLSKRTNNAMGHETLFPPSANINGTCFIGATTVDTPHITFPDFVKDLDFLPLAQSIGAEATTLRNTGKCKAIILVAHAGLGCKKGKGHTPKHLEIGACNEPKDGAEMKALLEELSPGQIDLAIAGHTHIHALEVINGTPVLESGALSQSVDALHLFYNKKNQVQRVVLQQIDLTSEQSPQEISTSTETTDVTTQMETYRIHARKIKARVLGSSTALFARSRSSENALGNMAAESMFHAIKRRGEPVVAAIINSGGIRFDLPMGQLTYGDVYKTLPFDNNLVKLKLTGAELLRALEIANSGAHGVPGLYNINVVVKKITPGITGPWDRDLNNDGKKEPWERNLIENVKVDGKPLDLTKTYTIVTQDFLARGGDHNRYAYGQIDKRGHAVYYNIKTRDAFADYIKQRKAPLKPTDYYDPPLKARVQWNYK